jgi:hypothetical protein
LRKEVTGPASEVEPALAGLRWAQKFRQMLHAVSGANLVDDRVDELLVLSCRVVAVVEVADLFRLHNPSWVRA